jgi:outer membrane protein OmpA-like peptidoglycan-associated protein
VRLRTLDPSRFADSLSQGPVHTSFSLPPLVLAAVLLGAAPCRADATATLVGGAIVLSGPLVFETHGGTLDPADAPLLDAIAQLLRAHPSMVIEIGAHTDARGSEEFNFTVTESVARQVRMALISRGIAAPRLRAVGYGESRPIADNMTAAGRAANRRIELVVVHP